MKKTIFCAAIALFIVLLPVFSAPAKVQGQRQQPPEYKEVVAASRIMDAPARLKEFERIKVVFFAQEKESKKVLNAVVAEVR
jgi:ribosomal protein L14E/L6E/L27E